MKRRLTPAERKANREKAKHAHRFAETDGQVAVDVARLAPTGSWSPPDFVTRGYYVDEPFACRDCGEGEIWTASQQKWWYEVARGDIFTVASRCRNCRRRERERRNAARRVHLEGLVAKYGPGYHPFTHPPGVRIELLRDRLEFLPLLAAWHHVEWGHLRQGDTVERRISRLEGLCESTEKLPAIFIALKGGLFAGSAMLLAHDMETRQEFTPWLAGVFTVPRYRRQGIASALSRHVVHHAATLGFTRLWLYTFGTERFYERLGWTVVEHTWHRGHEVTLMAHDEPASQKIIVDHLV